MWYVVFISLLVRASKVANIKKPSSETLSNGLERRTMARELTVEKFFLLLGWFTPAFIGRPADLRKYSIPKFPVLLGLFY